MTDQNRAADQAKAQFGSIKELIKHQKHVWECRDDDCQKGKGGGDYWETVEEYHDDETIRTAIDESPLCAEIIMSFQVLLCTGGPAVRIVGTLDEHLRPESASLEYQDWGTPWTEFPLDSKEEETLLDYCHNLFGE